MFESFKRIFRIRIRTRSLGAFIKVLKSFGCKEVEINVGRYPKMFKTSVTAAVGRLGDYGYGATFTSRTPDGRRVVLTREYFIRFSSEYGFGDQKRRSKYAIRKFLLAEEVMLRIKREISGAKVNLIGPNDQVMDDKMFDKIHADAKAMGVKLT